MVRESEMGGFEYVPLSVNRHAAGRITRPPRFASGLGNE